MRLFPSSRASYPPISLFQQQFTSPTFPREETKTTFSIPGGELLKGLLVVRVVGIDVASESTSGSGESSALDGLLDEEGSRGRAGEGGGARARGAADEGGDGHGCGCVCG
jgi:hypothetical protein